MAVTVTSEALAGLQPIQLACDPEQSDFANFLFNMTEAESKGAVLAVRLGDAKECLVLQRGNSNTPDFISAVGNKSGQFFHLPQGQFDSLNKEKRRNFSDRRIGKDNRRKGPRERRRPA
ncbi:MAG: hypothetical protein WC268_03405 [Patescibacteria group bacterium]|jgi:hypothetical protein